MNYVQTLGLFGVVTLACGGSTQASSNHEDEISGASNCTRGSERCACLSDGTCDNGLVCGSSICVEISQSTGSSGSGSSGQTSTPSTNGGSTSTAPDISRINIPELVNSCGEIAASGWARTDATGKRDAYLTATPCSAFLSGKSLAMGDYFVLEGSFSDTTTRTLTLQAFEFSNNFIADLSLLDNNLDALTLDRTKSRDTYTLFQYVTAAPHIVSKAMTYAP